MFPPSARSAFAVPMRTHGLKVYHGRLIEEALTVDVRARTFDRRRLIVDLRVRTRRHLPFMVVCVALLTTPFAFPLQTQFVLSSQLLSLT